MVSIKISKNNLFFVFLIFGYILGVMLYDFIDFKYTDELMAAFLVLFTGLILWERRRWSQAKPLYILGGIFLFYIIYSFMIKSNVPKAILMDATIQIKPFLGFYCTYLLMPVLSKKYKLFITIMCLSFAFILLIIALLGHIDTIFGHPSRYATAAVATAFLYLYCSSYTWKDLITFILILSVGILSTRSKFYGFFMFALFFSIMLKSGYRFKTTYHSVLLAFFLLFIVLIVAWDKIDLYFIVGTMNNTGEKWARPALYGVSFLIFIDYLPFGSGLGSFATYTSAQYYSKTYAEYHIDRLWGLSKDYPDFISDTYYPSLAQFGIVGLFLFVYFWIRILKAMFAYKKKYGMDKLFLITTLIIAFFGIECIADSTFTHNRGFFILVILGLTLSEMHSMQKE